MEQALPGAPGQCPLSLRRLPLKSLSPTLCWSRRGAQGRAGCARSEAYDHSRALRARARSPTPRLRSSAPRAPHTPAARSADPPGVAAAGGRRGSRARGRGLSLARRPAVRRGRAARARAAQLPGPAAAARRSRRPPRRGPSGALRPRPGRIPPAAAHHPSPPPDAPCPPGRRRRTRGSDGPGARRAPQAFQPVQPPSSCSSPDSLGCWSRKEEPGSSAQNFESLPPPAPPLH